jgi:hypothetical protein
MWLRLSSKQQAPFRLFAEFLKQQEKYMKRRFRKSVILLCCVLNTTACTTAKAIKETGNEFSQGNIITGLWYGTMGITMAALVDVVTLGGTTDATTGSKALVAAANPGSSYSNALIASNSLVALAGGGEIPHSSSYDSSTSMASQAIAGPSGSGASIGGSCHSDLSYLSSRMPSFSQSLLENIRVQILNTKLSDTMRAASQQGYSPESAINSSLEQARAYDETVRQALSTAAATDGFGTTDDEFLDSLKRGTLSVSTCEGIRNAALCDAINNKLGAVASRALAADMQCHLRAGTWAR